MNADKALAELEARARPGKSAEMARYHKTARRCLGVANPDIDELAGIWSRALSLEERISLADGLWRSGVHETRIAAAKLLTRTRIRPDEAVWRLIASWVPEFDGWAIADHACIAGQKRLAADPSRLDEVEPWTRSGHLWTRRAALVITLPWARKIDPDPEELEARERALGWAAGYVDDPEWFIQKAIAWWVRDLSKRDPGRSRAFLEEHGARMKPFARREAGRHLDRA